MQANYEELITLLIGAMNQRSLFYREHPRVQAGAADFVRGLATLREADGKQMFFLGIVEGRLVHEGRFLFGSTLLGRKLLQFAERMHCGGLLFREGLTEEDVLGLLDLCAELRQPLPNLQDARERLAAKTERIQLSPVYEDPGWFGQFLFSGTETWADGSAPAPSDPLVPIYQSLFDTVDEAHSRAATHSEIDVDGARSVTEQMLKASKGSLSDILRMVRYPNYDTYTVGHSVRVALLAIQVGIDLGLPGHFLTELGTAGLLHDAGKAKIPNEILFKPGRLDDEERRIMSQHPRLGAEILVANAVKCPLAVGAAFGHHIRHDRGGYPAISTWHQVGRATALVHVCDVFEALTAVRPYKPPLTPRRALEIMVADRGAFHPGAMSALVRSQGLYPPGSLVLLSSGERAIVTLSGPDFERPQVRLTHDARGEPLPREQAPTRDLAQLDAGELSIVRLLDDPAPSKPRQAVTPHAC